MEMPPSAWGSIIVVTFVLEHGRGAEHREPVGETARNEELTVILGRQFHRHMAAVGGRTLADIDCHIEHTPHHAAHKFCLCEGGDAGNAVRASPRGWTWIHCPEQNLCRGRWPRRTRGGCSFRKKISALVVEYAWLKDEHAVNIGFDYFHESKLVNK